MAVEGRREDRGKRQERLTETKQERQNQTDLESKAETPSFTYVLCGHIPQLFVMKWLSLRFGPLTLPAPPPPNLHSGSGKLEWRFICIAFFKNPIHPGLCKGASSPASFSLGCYKLVLLGIFNAAAEVLQLSTCNVMKQRNGRREIGQVNG